MHSFEVSLGYESVDQTKFSTCSASLKMYFGQRCVFNYRLEYIVDAVNGVISLKGRLRQINIG
jgi:hypothetical protein